MQETVQTTVNYILSAAGFIFTFAVLIGVPASVVFLIIGLIDKDPKSKKKHLKWALIALVVPVALIVVVLVSFAVVNTVLS